MKFLPKSLDNLTTAQLFELAHQILDHVDFLLTEVKKRHEKVIARLV